MARPEKVRLGEMLIQQKLVTEQQVQAALDEQKRSGRKLGRIFVDKGFISEQGLSQALARQLQVPWLDLQQSSPQPESVQKLPEAQARRFRALVVADVGAAFRVAMVDPTDLNAYDELTRLLRREIEVVVVTESDLLAAIDRLYRRTEEISGLAQELGAELGDVPLEFGDLFGTAAGQEEAPVVRLLQTVMEDATRARASDIHIEPQEASLVIRFRIDGVLHVQTTADIKIATALALRLKLMSGLDISEKRLPQDGRFNVKIGNAPVDVRISTMPTQFGESVVMRLLNHGTGLISLEKLGMPPHILGKLRECLQRPSGMILVTGPTGSGKTTTLYAMLKEINSPEKKIITVEDPVEYRLPGLNQVQVHDKIDLSFGRVLRAALRQDPDIILVGEMRDQETAEIGMRAAMTGHLVLSTLHTNDAESTPVRLLDMGVPRYMVALSLHLVIAQRLLRLICERCARDYDPAAHEREWLRTDIDRVGGDHVYRIGVGCQNCGGTGYSGRSGVYEMLEMTQGVVAAANQDDPAIFVAAARAQMAGNSLRRDAVRLVAQGRTTVAEAMRVATQYEDG